MYSNYLLLISLFLIFSCKNPLANKALQENEIINSSVHCNDCDIELLRTLRLNIENIDHDTLVLYLKCLNKECFKNVEFGQAANYSLFILLQEQSELLIITMKENLDSLNLDYIRLILENPISEDIDVSKTYETVNDIKVETGEWVKEEILKSLKVAIEKL